MIFLKRLKTVDERVSGYSICFSLVLSSNITALDTLAFLSNRILLSASINIESIVNIALLSVQ